VAKRVVVIDNYDSFTYNLVQLLEELDANCDVRLNDRTTPDDVLRSLPHGVVISPGPGSPETSGITEAMIALAAGRVPLLGVCLGYQAIGRHFGATLRRAASPVHGKASLVEHDGRGLFRNVPSPFAAGRYHSLVLDEQTLPDCLAVSARTTAGELMAVRHADLAIDGVQFHPESILTEHGKTLLGNWLDSLDPGEHALRTRIAP
jgi:anthranilate synthase/aminodeoxychorismate synthase-like glutamine amidotransferase